MKLDSKKTKQTKQTNQNIDIKAFMIYFWKKIL